MKTFAPILLFLLLTSCSTVRVHQYKQLPEFTTISAGNEATLNGEYQNKSGETSADVSGYSLWINLFPAARNHEDWKYGTVRFRADSGKLVAELYVNGIPVNRYETVYKISQGGYSLKRKWTAHFFIGPVIWAAADWKVLLAIDKNQNLVLFRASSGSTMFFIIPFFPAGGQTYFVYDRIQPAQSP